MSSPENANNISPLGSTIGVQPDLERQALEHVQDSGVLGTVVSLTKGAVLDAPIRAKWLELGGANGLLGAPITSTKSRPDGHGRYNHFQKGSIFWTAETGAHALYGPIRAKWLELGAETSFLGYPKTDPTGTSIGLVAQFQIGRIVLDQAGQVQAQHWKVLPLPYDMAPNWSFYRDRLVLNDRLAQFIQSRKLAPGSRLLLAGREVVVQGRFALNNYHLSIRADVFNGAGGQIELATTDTGKEGPMVTMFCRQLQGINIRSAGAKGARGAMGEMIEGPIKFSPGGHEVHMPPHRGTGKPGGKGGQGGLIMLFYAEDHVPGGFKPSASLVSAPGEGGDGGSGVPNGANGPAGSPIPAQVSQGSSLDYWDHVYGSTEGWANYRVRVADYYFRRYTAPLRTKLADQPSGVHHPVVEAANEHSGMGTFSTGGLSGNLNFGEVFAAMQTTDYSLAQSELHAALQILPQHPLAAALQRCLLSDQNIFGLPRDLDILPNYEKYDTVLRGWYPLVRGILTDATTLFGKESDFQVLATQLNNQVKHLQGELQALNAELNAAEAGKGATESELSWQNQRLENVNKRIDARRQELRDSPFNLGDVLSTAFEVAEIAAVAYATGGASLIAYAPDVMAFVGNEIDPSLGQAIASQAGGLGDMLRAYQGGEPVPALSFSQVNADLDSAGGDEELKELLKEQAEVAHAQQIAALREKQAEYAEQAAKSRLALGENDLEQARQALVSAANDEAKLRQAALQLMQIARAYMDMLIKYAFRAARSLEIYTLSDKTAEIAYDYGHIHPDIEEDYKDGLLQFTDVIAIYEQAWSKFGRILGYREAYDSYFEQSWAAASYPRSFKNMGAAGERALASLRQSPSQIHTKPALISFLVKLDNLPPQHFEARVTGVKLRLEGVTAATPSFMCRVEHLGKSLQRRRGAAKPIPQYLKPQHTIVTVNQIDATTYEGSTSPEDPSKIHNLQFWGRGVATTWTVAVEAGQMQGIDLSKLSNLIVTIEYETIT